MSEVINMLSATKDWRSIEPVNKGWSDDQKYRAIKRDGKTCLLRLTDAGSVNGEDLPGRNQSKGTFRHGNEMAAGGRIRTCLLCGSGGWKTALYRGLYGSGESCDMAYDLRSEGGGAGAGTSTGHHPQECG